MCRVLLNASAYLCDRVNESRAGGYDLKSKSKKTMDLLELSKAVPGLSVTVKLEDLLRANEMLVSLALEQSEEQEPPREEQAYMTRREVLEKLRKTPATLYRWAKAGYLEPVQIGGRLAYRTADVEAILYGRK